MNRKATRKDPLLAVHGFTFDKNGNLTQSLDRKSQATGVTYDPLNRPKVITFADSSTITMTYDGGNRVTSIVDSLNGTISRTYDSFDRVLTETTAQGVITYAYDAIGRRSTMQVTGQTIVSYGYDNANRMTSITQGSSVVSFTYDSSGRRSTVTYPNGAVLTLGYDAASRMTSMTWAKAGSSLGNLTYTYDAAGRRTSMGGSLARVGLPAALSSASFDAANRMTSRGGVTMTYDANGNLTNDGSQTFTWNSRDQLTAVGSASFAYDAGGRRRSRTVAGGTTGFLYDGANPIQEIVGGSPSANVLGGMALDEVYQRTDAAGARSLQVDGLNSTLGLLDSGGSATTQYTYEPFGGTTVSGSTSGNGFQYTGREADGTGLMYYRARYYSPMQQRFISEDPLGFGGEDVNLYAYVGNGPTNAIDPTGKLVIAVGVTGCLVSAGLAAAALLANNDTNPSHYVAGLIGGCMLGSLLSIGIGSLMSILMTRSLIMLWTGFYQMTTLGMITASMRASAWGAVALHETFFGELLFLLNAGRGWWDFASMMFAFSAIGGGALAAIGPTGIHELSVFFRLEMPTLVNACAPVVPLWWGVLCFIGAFSSFWVPETRVTV
jgi:RHS repeat-associated protein